MSVSTPRPLWRRLLIWTVLLACTVSCIVYAALWIRTVFDMRARQQEGLIAMRVCDAWQRNHDGLYPPMSGEPGVLMFDEAVLKEVRAPEATPAWMKSVQANWWYLGYAFSNEEEAARFAAAYQQRTASGGGFAEDLPAPDGGSVPRLRLPKEGDAPPPYDPAKTPLFIQKPGHYAPVNEGAWVGFADGSWEFFKKFPAGFPWTPEVVTALQSLEKPPAN